MTDNTIRALNSLIDRVERGSYHVLPYHFTFTFVDVDGSKIVRNPPPAGYPDDRIVHRVIQLVESHYEVPDYDTPQSDAKASRIEDEPKRVPIDMKETSPLVTSLIERLKVAGLCDENGDPI